MKKFRYLIIAAIIALDQAVKLLIRRTMNPGQSISVISDFFQITYVKNLGAAFNIFMGKGLFLAAVTFLALGAAVWYMEKNLNTHPTFLVAMILIIAGGAGNLIDRAVLGFVTDMFDFGAWPVFNVADIAICVGCGILILYMFVFDKSDKKQEKKA